MSVGCNTLLLPAGHIPTRTHRRRNRSAMPHLPAGVFCFDTPGCGRALYPDSRRASSLRVAGLPQTRIAAATACLIGAGGAMPAAARPPDARRLIIPLFGDSERAGPVWS